MALNTAARWELPEKPVCSAILDTGLTVHQYLNRQLLGPAHPLAVEVLMDGQAGFFLEAALEMIGTHTG